MSKDHAKESTTHCNLYVEEFTDEYLQKEVENLKLQNRVTALESEMIEKFFERNDPSALLAVQQTLELAVRMTSADSQVSGVNLNTPVSKVASLAPTPSLLRSPSRMLSRKLAGGCSSAGGLILGSGIKTNARHRLDMIKKEMDIITNDMKKERKRAVNQSILIRAHLENIGNLISENKAALARYDEQIGYTPDGSPNNKISGEYWIKFMNEWIRLADAQVSTYRLKSSTLTTQHHKLKDILVQKEELGKSLRPIDFEKIAIENRLCSEAIEKKNAQLIAIKKTASNVNTTLNSHKIVLLEQTTCMNKLYSKIEQRLNQTAEINTIKEKMEPKVRMVGRQLKAVHNIRMLHEIPQVIDYVKVKAQIHELQNNIKHLQSIKIPKLFKLEQLLRQK